MNSVAYRFFVRLGLAILLGIAAAPCGAAVFHSDTGGYSLDLPEGWGPLPRQAIARLQAIMFANQKFVVDACLQLESADKTGPQYPYVLVMIQPYRNFGLNRQLNEGEFPDYVRGLTNGVTQRAARKTRNEVLTTQANGMFSNLELVGTPQLDTQRRRYLASDIEEVKGVGSVREYTVGYFGHTGVVQVVFCTPTGDWDRGAATARALADSFRYDPDRDYSVQAAARAKPVDILDPSFMGHIAGAVLGVVIVSALVIFVVKKLVRPSHG
jgi:hypothetical protein